MNALDLYGRTAFFAEKAAAAVEDALREARYKGQLNCAYQVTFDKDLLNPCLSIQVPTKDDHFSIFIDKEFELYKKEKKPIEDIMSDRCTELISWLQGKEKELQEEIAGWTWNDPVNEEALEEPEME